jgi:type I restriction enzyme M protein
MDSLGRYYTNSSFSELLVRCLQIENPNTIIDLGVGGGSLIKAAYNRWAKAKFIAADIDEKSIEKLNMDMPFVKVYNANGLKLDIEKTLLLTNSTIDIAVCNPPYSQIKEKKRFENLFIEANLKDCIKLNKITSDIVFLAQNLKLLRKSGELGIILPDNILTGYDFALLRDSILKNHNVKAIIELPERIFSKTEAKTHIALIEKDGSTKSKIPLFIAGKDGKCFDQIEINSSSLVGRMDFSYHKTNTTIKKTQKRLRDFHFELKRGNNTNAELKETKMPYLHSTSFSDGAIIKLNGKESGNFMPNSVLANAGDIVIARVGRGCVGKCALIEKGSIPISDCLYMIKAEEKIISSIWKFINSTKGKEWLKASAHGVCSKVLSKGDILDIPIMM